MNTAEMHRNLLRSLFTESIRGTLVDKNEMNFLIKDTSGNEVLVSPGVSGDNVMFEFQHERGYFHVSRKTLLKVLSLLETLDEIREIS